ncbi:hypothetical protein OHA21_12935 [Actinoplanes sp. NBC_00393]|uniref:hypothetical protein n=1 Tax=Actinoplanes sp. NBC_00393 TaxID=2975953 RepID=UPI002E1E551C
MPDYFIDYYELGELDADQSRETNYQRLKAAHEKARAKRGHRGAVEAGLLTEAMKIFNDPEKYAQYRAVWEQRRHGTPPVAEPAAEDKPLWSVLGTLAAKGLQTYLENKKQAQAEAPRLAPASSLSGLWRDSTGTLVQIEQNDTFLRVSGTDGFGQPVFTGEGQLRGRRIDYAGRNAAGQVANGVLEVARNGKVITGRLVWSQFNYPVGMTMVRLVRT